jgi:hypothetical protein
VRVLSRRLITELQDLTVFSQNDTFSRRNKGSGLTLGLVSITIQPQVAYMIVLDREFHP